MQLLRPAEIRRVVIAALAEDIGSGDVTTLATVPPAATACAVLRARKPLVVAGLGFAERAFRQLSSAVRIKRLVLDGQRAKAGQGLLEISGPAQALLSAERVALNFVQRLSGVATLTAQFVETVRGTRAQILDRGLGPGVSPPSEPKAAVNRTQSRRFASFEAQPPPVWANSEGAKARSRTDSGGKRGLPCE